MSRGDAKKAVELASPHAAIDARVVVARRGFRLDARVHVDHGETLAVMGPSGAGKSTLVQAIAGVTRVTDGEVLFGHDVRVTRRRHVRPQKRGVVLLGQEPRLFPHLTARENVAFGLRARGLARTHARTEADDWLWRVGLAGLGDYRPRDLSGGQQQRVAIARALAAAPRAILLDEPLTSLDAETAADIRALLQDQIAAARVAAIVVTHDAVDAATLGQRLVVLEDGRVTQEGHVREVFATPATPFVATIAGLNRVTGTARGGGCVVMASEGPIRIGGPDASATGGARGAQAADAAPVTAFFRPADVRLERASDESWTGALRLARETEPQPGEWLTRVVRFESTPSGVRVVTSEPRVTAEVAAGRVAELRLAPGDPVRLRVDPAAVRVVPRADAGGATIDSDE